MRGRVKLIDMAGSDCLCAGVQSETNIYFFTKNGSVVYINVICIRDQTMTFCTVHFVGAEVQIRRFLPFLNVSVC